jgi:hypothetical protein
VRAIESVEDGSLRARIVRRVPMHYAGGADATTDRPAHVRAASSMAWVGSRVALVQDDVNFVALVDPATGLAEAIPLPAGKDDRRQFDDGRGNKKHKLDLEALMRVPHAGGATLVAFGSGSKKRRESVLTLRVTGRGAHVRAAEPVLTHLPDWYAALREDVAFAGSEMNIEGALYSGGVVRLFGRGNGESRGDLHAVDATGDVPWAALEAHLRAPASHVAPLLSNVTQYALGEADGVRYGFTDAIAVRRGVTLYSAAAEASENAVDDGAVVGSSLGVLRSRGGVVTRARWAAVRDERGRAFGGKIEGVVLVPGDAGRALVVVDVDDHTRPSELCEVVLEGAWFAEST